MDMRAAGGKVDAFGAALRKLLRPLVRLLLARGITYSALIELLKSTYVDVASEEFRLEGRPQTDSRISLLTGVHRKDVRRLRGEPPTPEVRSYASSLGGQLVARWTGVADYLDEHGRPRPLPRLISEGGAQSFEALVQSVSKDIRSRAVLDEWLRMGVARLDDQGRVELNADAFIPQRDFDEKAYYFGQNLHDHMAAGAHNLLGGDPPFLERCVYYDGLSTASIDELARLSSELGMEALRTVNRRALELQQQNRQSDVPGFRMNFGIYYYSGRGGYESIEPIEPKADDA